MQGLPSPVNGFLNPPASLFCRVWGISYDDTNLGGSSSLYQVPNQTESSPQVREVRRKRRVVLQRCRGRGLYMVSGSATVLFLRERHTHTRCQCQEKELLPTPQDLLLCVSLHYIVYYSERGAGEALARGGRGSDWRESDWGLMQRCKKNKTKWSYWKPNHVLEFLCKIQTDIRAQHEVCDVCVSVCGVLSEMHYLVS